MLKPNYLSHLLEAGVDEAGRGCLAGPVTAAAVILPPQFESKLLNDSKKLTANQRFQLREVIEKEAIAFAVAWASVEEIESINILNASILAMHRAIENLAVLPQHLLIDGNRFKKYKDIPHMTIIKGDATYMNIAAASILAKTYRDDYMQQAAKAYPQYDWHKNMGYPTPKHRQGILDFGISEHHRKTFKLLPDPELSFNW